MDKIKLSKFRTQSRRETQPRKIRRLRNCTETRRIYVKSVFKQNFQVSVKSHKILDCGVKHYLQNCNADFVTILYHDFVLQTCNIYNGYQLFNFFSRVHWGQTFDSYVYSLVEQALSIIYNCKTLYVFMQRLMQNNMLSQIQILVFPIKSKFFNFVWFWILQKFFPPNTFRP